MNNFKNNLKVNTYEEKLNYFDSNGNKQGTVDREEGIEKCLLLEAVQIRIINPDTKEVLMQQRSFDKENDPGMIDVSASGHVRHDETPTQALIREGKEEVGTYAFEKLIPSIKKLMDFEIDFSKVGRKGKYITHEYIAFSNQKLENYVKQDDEVKKLFFMKYDDVKEMIIEKDKNMRIPYNDDTKKLLSLIEKEITNLERQHTKEEI